ncbi:hypothetical protein TNCV_1800821 [Trichonephila clavipes]|nr:hypothetical protein TNCV_1800821 [Trichonephila clavipes]
MDVCKCIVPSRHGGTLNSRRASGGKVSECQRPTLKQLGAIGDGSQWRIQEGSPDLDCVRSRPTKAWELNTGGFRVRLTTWPEHLLRAHGRVY